MGYRVETELTIPKHLLDSGISPGVLRLYGFDPSTPQQDLKLAQLVLLGANYGGEWKVSALGIGKEPGQHEAVGSMWCSPGTRREEVLPTADAWVRESEASVWVPGPVVELPIEDSVYAQYAVNELILARGLM